MPTGVRYLGAITEAQLANSLAMDAPLPTGTVTFLFTDIEGSTKLAQRFGPDYTDLLADHFSVIRGAVSSNTGVEVNTTGDGLFASFDASSDAVSAAVAIQEGMSSHQWPEGGRITVRIGLHTGEATVEGRDYVGFQVHKAARIMGAGHGGQILASESTRLLTGPAYEFRALGEHLLRGLDAPVPLFQVVVPGLPTEFPPLNTASAPPTNLPARLTSIIGRESELEAVGEMLRAHRLVTILGPGGVGKTSLAITVAGEARQAFPGGLVFVDLSSVKDAALVVPSVALELGAEPKTVQGVADRLGDSPSLLVLDNFEQVATAATDVLALLERNSQVRVLVTSQVPLRLPGETRFQLGTLDVNGSGDSPGVRLFTERARAADPKFEADQEDVSALVRRLDGLPLAIELMAARANLLSPADMLRRLDEGRMTLAAPSSAPTRHGSLDEALRWSYSLLDDPTQRVFRALSVFAGSMTLAAIESVVASETDVDPVSQVGELIDRSLLFRESGSSTRFHMLDGVRKFGRQLLDDAGKKEEAEERFIDHFRSEAVEAYPGLQSDRGEWWRDHLEANLDNLREVLSLLHSEGRVAEGLELLGNTWRFYQSRGLLLEIELWLDRFFELPGADGKSPGIIKGLMARGAVRYWQERPEDAIGDYQIAVDKAEEADDPALLGDALYGLATSLIIAGRESEADPLLEKTKQIYERLGDSGGLADVVVGEAFATLNREGLAGLGPVFEKGSDLYRKAGRRVQAVQGAFAQTAVAIAEGRVEDARLLLSGALTESIELNDTFLQAWGLEYAARVRLEFDDLENAALLVGAAEASRDRIGGAWRPTTAGLEDAGTLLIERLGPQGAEDLIEPGRGLDTREAIDLALSL